MARFSRQSSRRYVALGLIGAGVVCALLGTGFASRIRNLAGVALAPFGDGGMYLTSAIQDRVGGLGRRALSPSTAESIQAERREIEGRLIALEAEYSRLVDETVEMARLYAPREMGGWALVPATVTGAGSVPYGESRALNSGSADGVAANVAVTTRALLTDRSKALPEALAVLGGENLVGRIVSSGAFTARLQLVTDKKFRTPALILRKVDGRLMAPPGSGLPLLVHGETL